MKSFYSRCTQSLLVAIGLLFVLTFTHATPIEYPSIEEQYISDYVSQYAQTRLSTQTASRIAQNVYRRAKLSHLDPMFILGLIRLESGFNPSARSTEGARGLMQVLPRAHKQELTGKSVTNIETNIALGIDIYSQCLKSKGTIKAALSCYSGGAGKKYYNTVVAYQHHAQHYVLDKMFSTRDTELALQ